MVGQVQHKIQVQKGEVIELNDKDSDDKSNLDTNISHHDTIDLVMKLKQLNIKFRGSMTLDLTRHLHKFCGFLHQEELLNEKQTSLEEYF